jgi:serine/threonine-protein kinase RsbW
MPTLVLSGSYENLAKFSEFVRQAAEDAGLDNFSIYQVETAVDEACSNIIDHAYGREGKGDIECTCLVASGELTIILRDWGIPFNPKKIRSPNLTAPLKNRKAHGLGLHFIRQWMDEVSFNFSGETGNVLTMVKRRGVTG